MKVLKWLGIGFVGLVILGAIVGNDDGSKKTAASTAGQTKTTASTGTATVSDAPAAPEEVSVTVTGPYETHKDVVTLRGTVSMTGAHVRVGGSRASVQGRHWTKIVTLRHKGDNTFKVSAVKHGHGDDHSAATITRKLSAAEKAVIRQQKAERRANRRALESAESYLSMSGFSKQGLYEQLSSSAGEGFTQAQAQYAVDHVDADWKKEAVESARSYLEMSPMSRAELIDQLSSSAGEGFTYEQALYAVNKVY
jgi:hypothetical protein